MGGKPKFNPENLSIGEPINEETYGYKVTNYDISVNGTTEWRLFYQDENYTYIITNHSSIEVEIDSILTNGKYSDGSKVGTIGKRLNSSLLKSEKCFTSQNTSNAIKMTAWLCDETVWKNYCDDNACFAIGSPTLDLFVASWNATAIETEKIQPQNQIDDFGYNYRDTSLGENQSRNHEIYDTYYWLSSPGDTKNEDPGLDNGTDTKLCLVYDSWDHILSSSDSYSGGLCPIVAIPTDVFTQNYHLANE